MQDKRKGEHPQSASPDESVHGEEITSPEVEECQQGQEEWQRLKDEADLEAYLASLADEPDPEPDDWMDPPEPDDWMDPFDFEPDDGPPDEELPEPNPDDWLPDAEPDLDPDDWR